MVCLQKQCLSVSTHTLLGAPAHSDSTFFLMFGELSCSRRSGNASLTEALAGGAGTADGGGGSEFQSHFFQTIKYNNGSLYSLSCDGSSSEQGDLPLLIVTPRLC